MAANISPAPTVFRTRPYARRIVLLTMIPLAVLAVPALLGALVFWPIWPLALALTAAAAVALVYGIRYAVRTRVEFGGGRYRQVFALTEHAFGIEDVAKVVPVNALDYGLQSAAHLFVVGKDGRGLIQLNDQILERSQLEALVTDLTGRGAPVEHLTERISVGEFAKRYPRGLPWQLAHRIQYVLLATLIAIIVLGGAGVAVIVNVLSLTGS